jgi:hypothetical protein
MDQFFLKNQKKVTKEVYDHQIKNDQFYSVLQSNFPGSMPLPEYIKKHIKIMANPDHFTTSLKIGQAG